MTFIITIKEEFLFSIIQYNFTTIILNILIFSILNTYK